MIFRVFCINFAYYEYNNLRYDRVLLLCKSHTAHGRIIQLVVNLKHI